MGQVLDDDVRMLESAWFMSYPHDVFRRLRNEAPVYRSERDGIWAITKYEDVRMISRSPKVFANGYHVYSTGALVRGERGLRSSVRTPMRAGRRSSTTTAWRAWCSPTALGTRS